MQKNLTTDVAIIGAGPSGLFAAFQAGMLGMKSVIIDALDAPGGQCSALYPEKPIYDIPAYPEIEAQMLVDKHLEQLKPFDAQFIQSEQVNALEEREGNFILGTSGGSLVQSKIVVIAAGAGAFGPNRPPLQGIEKYEGKSVFYFVPKRGKFKDKKVVIAGGGDSALDWAVSLSSIAKVSLVHRRAKFRGAPATIAKVHELAEQGKIDLVVNYQLNGLEGNGGDLEKVIVADLDGNKKVIEADCLLPFFGLAQDLGPIHDFGLNIKSNHIEVDYPYFETNIPGIYAIGDVAKYEGKLKLILTSYAEAASVMHHAYKRVFDGKALHFEYSTTKCAKK